jgi:hypothetical protein
MESLTATHHAVGLGGDVNIQKFSENTKKFKHMRFVVHTTGAWPTSGLSGNHISIFLLLPNQESVRINMKTDSNDIKGVLVWSEHDYQTSSSEITHQDYECVEMEVRQFYNAIRYIWAMHRYQFSAGGSGCHYWS